MSNDQNLLARYGLTLSKNVLRRLQSVGIVAQSQVSLEHQHLAKRYVVRGIESGGAVREIGRYVTYAGTNGEPLPYLHPLDAIGVNGVHAVVVAPVLVRIELFRTGRTCQLLITKHEPMMTEAGRRPRLLNSVLFRGVNGCLSLEDTKQGAATLPQFWSRAGEEQSIPAPFSDGVNAAVKGAICIGCSHSHYLAAADDLRQSSDAERISETTTSS